MDGYSHHDRKKRDLQVSKRGSKICKGKRHKWNMRAKGGIDQGDGTVSIFIRAYLFVYVICE